MERGKLPTELEFAPITRDELLQAIGGLICDGECAYNAPRLDRHHEIYSHDNDLTDAEKLLKSHPNFITTICRCAHECIHKTWDRSEPLSDQFVIGYLLASPVSLSANNRRKLNKLRSGG